MVSWRKHFMNNLSTLGLVVVLLCVPTRRTSKLIKVRIFHRCLWKKWAQSGTTLHFSTSFSQNKPVLIGFFWDKLIKHAHNPIKEEYKLIKQSEIPIKKRIICKIFCQQWKCTSCVKNFGRIYSNTLAHVHPSWVHVQYGSTSLFMWRKKRRD